MIQPDRQMPLYTISVVAKIVGVHEQTLRIYERRGLLCPARVSGHSRMYSQADLELLEDILYLIRDMGINLNGARVILHMAESSEQIRGEIRSHRISEGTINLKQGNDHEELDGDFLD
jgi:MerR family transcriptional regulator/heat shock protein HspR